MNCLAAKTMKYLNAVPEELISEPMTIPVKNQIRLRSVWLSRGSLEKVFKEETIFIYYVILPARICLIWNWLRKQ